jgi:DNA invertase Pin-like site-specific DNA recombinase
VSEAIDREGGRQVVGTFGEANQSGYRKERGPALEAAMQAAITAAAECGEAELWVFHSSRLARGDGTKGRRSLGKVVFDLLYENVVVRSVTDNEMVTPMLAGIGGKVSNQYSEDLSAHVKRGLRQRKEAGEPVGSLPDGYMAEQVIGDDGRPVVRAGRVVTRRVLDPAEAPIMEDLFESLANGATPGEVVRKLNATGAHLKRKGKRRGKPYTAKAVQRIAENTSYGGENGYPALGTAVLAESGRRQLKPMDPVAVQRPSGGRRPHEDYMLKGIGSCRCGVPLYTSHNYCSGERAYACRDLVNDTGLCKHLPIPAKLVERHVLEHLDCFMDSVEGWIADLLAERDGERGVRESQLDEEEAALAVLDRRRDERMAEVEEKGADPIVMEAIARIDVKREAQQQRITDADAILAEWAATPQVNEALDFYNRLHDLVAGRVKQAQGVKELNDALAGVLSGLWCWIEDGKLRVEFELRDQPQVFLPNDPVLPNERPDRDWLPPVEVGPKPDHSPRCQATARPPARNRSASLGASGRKRARRPRS